jgi:predicted MFS family arabinose efflux permease
VSIHGTLIHSVALLTDRGIGVQAAAAIYSSVGLAMTAGRVACGYCLDKLHGSIISIGSFVIPMVGIGLLATGIGGAVPLLGILLCGLGMGAQIGLQSFFPSRYFGLKAIGAISGVIFGLFLAGVGLGPYISGVSFDTWHSYIPAFVGYLVALTVAALFFAPLGPYPFAVRKPTAN